MRITKEIFATLQAAFPAVPPEAGGILGSSDGGKTVTHFVFDTGTSRTDRAIYIPDVAHLNREIQTMAAKGIRFCGIVHSHPTDQTALSEADKIYMRAVIAEMPDWVKCLYCPIVIPQQEVIPFSIDRMCVIRKETLKVISYV